MTADSPPRVLYVLGAGHCGSTLLSLLLNGHPACVAVSEVSKLADAIRDRDPVLETPAWRDVAACYARRTGAPFEALDLQHPSWRQIARWSDAEIRAWARPRAALMACLHEVTGRAWIVDASKSWQPLYLMQRSGLFDVRVVHLIRDARGVVHSYAKKYGELHHGLSRWFKPSVAGMVLAPRFEGGWIRTRYELLASDPAAALAPICALLEVPYAPGMLQFRDHAWLGIGGNRMAKRPDSAIRLDERWRREMPWRSRLIVDVLGGALNRYYGYSLR